MGRPDAHTPPLEDAELVRRVLNGATHEYGVLVERYRKEFARYATATCGDADTAADAMQEAFIRAYEALATCRDPSQFGAWFFRILTNQCHNARDRRREHVVLERITAEAADRADDALAGSEMRDAIVSAIDQLTPEQREAFVLKHVQGYSYAQIAELLGADIDALKMRVYRARNALRARLETWL